MGVLFVGKGRYGKTSSFVGNINNNLFFQLCKPKKKYEETSNSPVIIIIFIYINVVKIQINTSRNLFFFLSPISWVLSGLN